jgi:hypothetical protein
MVQLSKSSLVELASDFIEELTSAEELMVVKGGNKIPTPGNGNCGCGSENGNCGCGANGNGNCGC